MTLTKDELNRRSLISLIKLSFRVEISHISISLLQNCFINTVGVLRPSVPP